MKCPFCGNVEDKVVDSRANEENNSIRRRRECLGCNRRFTTYEQIEAAVLMVIKKDGARETFDSKKLLSGVMKACEKRPVSAEKIEKLVDKVSMRVQREFEKEINAAKIGEFVMEELQELDEIAYIRFASVYRQFKDVTQFMSELKAILNKGK